METKVCVHFCKSPSLHLFCASPALHCSFSRVPFPSFSPPTIWFHRITLPSDQEKSILLVFSTPLPLGLEYWTACLTHHAHLFTIPSSLSSITITFVSTRRSIRRTFKTARISVPFFKLVLLVCASWSSFLHVQVKLQTCCKHSY